MQVAVFDTYVRKRDGSTVHFDIIAPKETTPEQAITFGKTYLQDVAPEGRISSRECQLCHIEEPSAEVISAILDKGFYILEFDDIPAELPANPTRRQLIEHIRAQSEEYRFANFRGVEEERLWEIIRGL